MTYEGHAQYPPPSNYPPFVVKHVPSQKESIKAAEPVALREQPANEEINEELNEIADETEVVSEK